MNSQRIQALVKTHPVASFFVLAYAFSWIGWLPVVLGVGGSTQTLSFIAGGFGPALAGGVVTWLCGDSVRAWARQVVHWRVAPWWYLVAALLPLVVVGLATVGLVLLGTDIDPSVLPGRALAVLMGYVTVALVGGGNEEPGWRGVALPRLQAQYAPVPATLVLGVVWAVWHLPLLATDPSTLAGLASLADVGVTVLIPLLNIVGFAFLLTWVYNGTDSVFVALLTHAGFNTANSTLVPLSVEVLAGEGSTAVLVTVTVAVWVVALLLVAVTRGRLGLATAERPAR